jgi:hypothetical protein
MKIIFALLAFLTVSTFASEEDSLSWESFKIGLGNRPETGEITVTGVVGQSGYTKLSVSSFGKTYDIADDILDKLSPFIPSIISATHEAGYSITGGHTVHIIFTRILTDSKGALIRETATLSVPKDAVPAIRIK